MQRGDALYRFQGEWAVLEGAFADVFRDALN